VTDRIVFHTDDEGRRSAAAEILHEEGKELARVVVDNPKADPFVREWLRRELGRVQ